MAKILNFENFLSKRELDKITEFAEKEFAPVKLDERRPSPTEPQPLVTLKRQQPPKKAA